MKPKRLVYIGALVSVSAAAWMFINGGTQVETVLVQRGDIVKTVEDTGYVQPATGYDIDAIRNARVVQVPLKVGDPVRQGQTLLVMEDLDLDVQVSSTSTQLSQAVAAVAGDAAALETARLQLADSQSNSDRYDQLYGAGAVSKSAYDKAHLALDTAQQAVTEQSANLDAARAQVHGLQQTLDQLKTEESRLVVSSPVDGVILSLPAKEQQVVLPGTPLVRLAAAPGHLEIKADILSDDMADVREGEAVTISAPVLGRNTLSGTVQQIYPQAEEEQSALGVIQRRVPVIITLPEPRQLKPGFEVRVAIQIDSRKNVLMVPTEAVRTAASGHKEVVLVVNGRVHHQVVTVGIGDRKNFELTEGLRDGDRIVRDGSLDLAENARVKSMP